MYILNILYIIFLKIFTVVYYYNLDNSKNKDTFLRSIQTFFTYTNSGLMLSLISKLFLIFNYKFTIIDLIAATTLLSTTLGYWFVVYPNMCKKEREDKFNIILDIMGHGPPFILFYINCNTNFTHFTYVLYPIYFNIFWFLLIWFPWYYVTNIPLYNSLSKKISLIKKTKTIIKILMANIVSYTILYILHHFTVAYNYLHIKGNFINY